MKSKLNINVKDTFMLLRDAIKTAEESLEFGQDDTAKFMLDEAEKNIKIIRRYMDNDNTRQKKT